MNYYIDFDNTLYDTAMLTDLMIEAVSKSVFEKINGKINYEEIYEYVKENFNSTYGNIFSYAEVIAKKYNVNEEDVKKRVNDVIICEGHNIVYKDAIRFLERIKENGDKCYILTFIPDISNQEYQMKKIIGANIGKYFDGIIISTEYKFLLDLNYNNGIFIDDDPRDLNGLFEKNPIKVIRIRKPSNKRSRIDIENKDIEEYESFDSIQI